jgi:hypothetical protein
MKPSVRRARQLEQGRPHEDKALRRGPPGVGRLGRVPGDLDEIARKLEESRETIAPLLVFRLDSQGGVPGQGKRMLPWRRIDRAPERGL